MARQGFDWVCIDMQHGVIDYSGAAHAPGHRRHSHHPHRARPWNEPGIIGKVLDAGAMGVIIPMVNSVEEARAAVAACRYFPQGARSFGPTRATYYAGTDYFAGANTEIACIPMIETKQAVERLDDSSRCPASTRSTWDPRTSASRSACHREWRTKAHSRKRASSSRRSAPNMA